jgi:hypothetical protein
MMQPPTERAQRKGFRVVGLLGAALAARRSMNGIFAKVLAIFRNLPFCESAVSTIPAQPQGFASSGFV